ncbi:adenosylcobinamide kinase /adenosylcobinamide-phosphate guanylyltransferase [Cognatiyoonia sediminum]|uniref:Bifunctional adenosylcobalamin biosynthesis protein n=1 Tax=Cognatiyoonia sediminum TaxID=1508389 RepID=A0A1M5NJB8_9RHOB|nr:bifunctional adenosylcobinamide kinase/adenosylcobinamide-phosphate guanylyltransferase [Cognatiyoonia sediminum]SHG89043.1 adenosylcobinamide kinase /adenosylcobinamide-phosphate guanylyltransferase [Cognatiyoonia sediminum]
MALHKLTFVLGGAASGKSALAEQISDATGKPKVYIATAQAFDDEMRQKIAAHQVSRGDSWLTVEEPFDLVGVLERQSAESVVLVDCLTLWLTNILLADHDLDAEFGRLIQALDGRGCELVLVSNEVGQGIVPDNALSRKFLAAQGRLNQKVAASADTVIAVMAGLTIALKGEMPL